MKLQTTARIKKVKEYLLSGYSRPMLITRLSQEFRLAPRTIDRFITIARKELMDEAREKKEVITLIRKEQIEEAANNLIASNLEAEACLTQILRGEVMEEKIVYKENVPEIMKVAPKISDKLKAIGMHFQSQCRGAKEKQPPMLEPLGIFFSEFPLSEIPYGDEVENNSGAEIKISQPLKETTNEKGSDAKLKQATMNKA